MGKVVDFQERARREREKLIDELVREGLRYQRKINELQKKLEEIKDELKKTAFSGKRAKEEIITKEGKVVREIKRILEIPESSAGDVKKILESENKDFYLYVKVQHKTAYKPTDLMRKHLFSADDRLGKLLRPHVVIKTYDSIRFYPVDKAKKGA